MISTVPVGRGLDDGVAIKSQLPVIRQEFSVTPGSRPGFVVLVAWSYQRAGTPAGGAQQALHKPGSRKARLLGHLPRHGKAATARSSGVRTTPDDHAVAVLLAGWVLGLVAKSSSRHYQLGVTSDLKPPPAGRFSKWRWGPVAFPVEPTSPIFWPALTEPPFTVRSERWQYQKSNPAARSTR